MTRFLKIIENQPAECAKDILGLFCTLGLLMLGAAIIGFF